MTVKTMGDNEVCLVDDGQQEVVFLLGYDRDARSSASFLIGLKQFDVEDFSAYDTAINRLEQLTKVDSGPFCIVVNQGRLDAELREFLKMLDVRRTGIPVVIVDRERCSLTREDYCRNASPDFPLFVCRTEEMVDFVSHLHLLKGRVKEMRIRSDAPRKVIAT